MGHDCDSLFRALNFNSKLSNSIRSSSMSMAPLHKKGGGGKSIQRAYDALLLGAGGTLLQLLKPVAETYASIGHKYCLTATTAEIKQGFRRAFAAPWPKKLRYEQSWSLQNQNNLTTVEATFQKYPCCVSVRWNIVTPSFLNYKLVYKERLHLPPQPVICTRTRADG